MLVIETSSAAPVQEKMAKMVLFLAQNLGSQIPGGNEGKGLIWTFLKPRFLGSLVSSSDKELKGHTHYCDTLPRPALHVRIDPALVTDLSS